MFPTIANSNAERTSSLALLSSHGLGTSADYPTSIAEISELEIPEMQRTIFIDGNGRLLAQQILTLPTHPWLSARDMTDITGLLKREASAEGKELALNVS